MNPVGFALEVWAECGGTLIAKEEPQTILFSRNKGNNDITDNGNCSYRIIKDDEEIEGDTIYLTLSKIPFNDGLGYISASDKCQLTCGINQEYFDTTSSEDIHISKRFETCNDDEIHLQCSIGVNSYPQLLTYGLENNFCGGEIRNFYKRIKYNLDRKKSVDCEWTFIPPSGFNSTVEIKPIVLPESDNCQDSYILIKSNDQVKRTCNSTKVLKISSVKVTVRLRYRVYEDTDLNIFDNNVLEIKGQTIQDIYATLGEIESPPYSEIRHYQTYSWKLKAKQNNSRIMILINKANLPDISRNSLKLQPLNCHSRETCEEVRFLGFVEDNPIKYYFNATQVNVKYFSIDKISYFKLNWKEITENEYQKVTSNYTATNEDEEYYNCGGELIATYEPQILENPKNEFGSYDTDLKCRWRIKKPMFSDIVIKIIKVDLESHPNCAYDYLGVGVLELSPKEVESHSYLFRYCSGNSSGNPMDLEYSIDTYIYFVSDRSRSLSGFQIQYSLGCKAYEYIKEIDSPLSADLTSPGYPLKYPSNTTCFWGVVVGSTRQLNVTVDLDIEGSDGNCHDDYLIMSTSPITLWTNNRLPLGNLNQKLCGRKIVQQTFNSRLFMYFSSKNNINNRKGFKMHLEEIIVDCSSNNLWIDELNPKKYLASPEYPHMSPNSLNCYWIINTLPGHRIKFTVDPKNFHLQNSDANECVDDYLEIRDGPAVTSPLVGRYCNEDAPSTVFSTDSVLYIKYVTDSYTKSLGFTATYELASCGGSVVLREGLMDNIISPNYPNPYPSKAECEWTVKAPSGHFVEAKLNHIFLTYSNNCTQDYVEIKDNNSTGDTLLNPSCKRMDIIDSNVQSKHNSIYVKFNANTTTSLNTLYCQNGMCGFDLAVSSTPFSCGGDITDSSGEITLPGYPDKIIRNVECEWRFDAGIGHRYVFKFKFLNEQNGYYMNSLSDHCYPDLEIFNGPPQARNNLISNHKRFCSNQTTFVSMADLVTIDYFDQSKNWLSTADETTTNNLIINDRFYKPWIIEYVRVDASFNREGCSSLITKNTAMRIGNLTVDGLQAKYIGARSFCHLQIQRPEEHDTTVLIFSDIKKRPGILRNCKQGNRVVITDPDSEPWPINEIICNSTNSANTSTFIYPNPNIDVYIINNPHKLYFDVPIEFKLIVKFYKCGGLIDSDDAQTGVLTSPNFGNNNLYSKNQYCLWYLKAPENQIVQLKFDYMDIETHIECNKDFLEVAEGQGFHSVLHRYCYGKVEQLPERFKVLRSHGRDISILWKTDDMYQNTGWNLTYSFVPFHTEGDPSCGFSSHSMSGEIISPNYPKDYPNNANCDWNIVVPLGYHVKLTFISVDIQNDCDKDSLAISQEHQSRALTPLNDYYFYFNHEENIKTICGNDQHESIISESNHVRVTFKTDEKIAGRGFKLKWEAECGTTLTLTHGVITSPHYPVYYPNDDTECNYLISPNLPDNATPIVTLKVLDFNLEPFAFGIRTMNKANYSIQCRGDYLEVIDVVKKRVQYKICGDNMGTVTETPPISIHGPIGVKFFTNKSFYATSAKKNYRGFKLSYAVADCGGDYTLDDTKEKLSTTIYSPGYPLEYHPNLDCVWKFTAPEDRILSIKFIAVDMEENANDCNFDFVELFGSIATNFSSSREPKSYPSDMEFMGRYCGNSIPKDYLVTNGNNLTIRFKSDHSNTKTGFKLVVTATLGNSAGCGGQLIATNEMKILEPPLDKFHNNKYYNGLRCLWNIKTDDPQKVVQFKFTELSLEQKRRVSENKSSCYDFVAIYDGSRSMSSFLLSPTCTLNDLPFIVQSSYRIADFYFETDSNDAYDGFTVEYKAVTQDCGGSYAASNENSELAFESQRGLTRVNQKHQRCRWMFYAPGGEPLLIEFKDFNFPSDDPTCPFEYLEIRDVGVVAECQHPACGTESHEKSVLRYCGKSHPTKYISTTSVVQITTSTLIQSQYSSSFHLTYQILDECNRTITFTPASTHLSGRLTSPNYPNTYDNNSTCITTLKVPLDWRILVVFNSFKLEKGENNFMRHRIPGISRYRWRTNALRRTDNFVIFNRNTCTYDFLKITLNPSTNETETFCGFILPPSLITTSDELTLELTTDASMAHGGYDLSYYITKPPKEITIDNNNKKLLYDFYPNKEKSGIITPIGYPKNYPNNTIQRFIISPPTALSCKFTLILLRTSDYTEQEDCSYNDYLLLSIINTDIWEKNNNLNNENLIWKKYPCSIQSAEELGVTKAKTYLFTFNTDNNNDNNGLGFRIQWTCSNYEEDIL